MRYWIVLALLLITKSCIPVKKGQKLFSREVCGQWYVFTPPEGYVQEIHYFNEHGYGQEYIYPDSSKFYVLTFTDTDNYENIRNQGTYNLRFWALHTNDTMTLSGKTKDKLYWKDRLLKCGITIGYTKVKLDKKKHFDQSIYSIKKCNLLCYISVNILNN